MFHWCKESKKKHRTEIIVMKRAFAPIEQMLFFFKIFFFNKSVISEGAT